MSARVINLHGIELRFADVLRQMDQGLLARLQAAGGYASDQELFERYAAAHVDTFHQSFPLYSGGRA